MTLLGLVTGIKIYIAVILRRHETDDNTLNPKKQIFNTFVLILFFETLSIWFLGAI